uniref:Regulator of G-protein signaling 7 n=1 Tax=Macrostomum lignano TaxID=282301 RepID=A0A1I8HYT6_9PLAT
MQSASKLARHRGGGGGGCGGSSGPSSSSASSSGVTAAAASSSVAAGSRSRQRHQQQQQQPNAYIWSKLESLLERLQNEDSGVTVRTVKSFMSCQPSCFTGAELCAWLLSNTDADDAQEACHVASMLAAHGYIIPVEGTALAVRNDSSYYRFQTPYLWPSRSPERLDNADYAVYLCKRTLLNKQRLELANYEAENLARLQRMLSHKWELIYLQAEAEAKVDRKQDRLERMVLESQERGFWLLHRPPPGAVVANEVDMRKLCRSKRPVKAANRSASFPIPSGRLSPIESCEPAVRADKLRQALSRSRVKVSKAAESVLAYYQQYSEFDAFIGGGLPDQCQNPWVSDSAEFWESDKRMRDIPGRRVKRWAFSIHELLRDPAGRQEFEKWLVKEVSGENLAFWEACQQLRRLPIGQVAREVQRIYDTFLGPDATEPVNVAGPVAEAVRRRMEGPPDRFAFEVAEEHIFQLMKVDSYNRFLRSDYYKDLLAGCKKKSKNGFQAMFDATC